MVYVGLLPYGTCHIQTIRYGGDQKFQPGTLRKEITVQTYSGDFNSGKRTTIFNGELSIIPSSSWGSRAAGVCNYSAEVGGGQYTFLTSLQVMYVMPADGSIYKIDAGQSPAGSQSSTSCNLKVTRVETVLPGEKPLQTAPTVVAANSNEGQIDIPDTGSGYDQSHLQIMAEREETVELQPATRIHLDSSAVYTYTHSASLGLEFGTKEGNTTGVNGGLSFHIFSVGTSSSQEKQIYAAIKPSVQLSAGVNLDGAKCRNWETSVYAQQIYAKANDPAAQINDSRFRFIKSIKYNAKSLCPGEQIMMVGVR